jgi:hypothetical protein
VALRVVTSWSIAAFAASSSRTFFSPAVSPLASAVEHNCVTVAFGTSSPEVVNVAT